MDLDNCDEKNIFLNLTTGDLECLPGVLIPPTGYSQLVPTTDVRPKPKYWKWALLAVGLYAVLKK
jgi:hypothetical protein